VRRPIVYFAGPDVFFDRPKECGSRLKALAAERGFEGLYPLDAEIYLVPAHFDFRAQGGVEYGVAAKRENARRIRMANLNMIQSADAVCANVIPFRGPSADVGTAWEMGFASALGKVVASYSHNERSYAARVPPDNFLVEDFALHDNLMLADAEHFTTPEAALDWIHATLGRP
jgi:nucleoside 2-deoxyribosyltransferase